MYYGHSLCFYYKSLKDFHYVLRKYNELYVIFVFLPLILLEAYASIYVEIYVFDPECDVFQSK